MLTNRSKIVLVVAGLSLGVVWGLALSRRAGAENPPPSKQPIAEADAPLPEPQQVPAVRKTGPAPSPNTPSEAPRAPEYFPRDPTEWQGLRVESSNPLHCGAVDSCNMALACVDGRCVACTDDSQCAPGEACTMDRCLPEANVGCRGRRDCAEDERCYLQGLGGANPRANTEAVAFCGGMEGENPHAEKENQRGEQLGGPSPLPPEALGVGYMNLDRVKRRARALLGGN